MDAMIVNVTTEALIDELVVRPSTTADAISVRTVV